MLTTLPQPVGNGDFWFLANIPGLKLENVSEKKQNKTTIKKKKKTKHKLLKSSGELKFQRCILLGSLTIYIYIATWHYFNKVTSFCATLNIATLIKKCCVSVVCYIKYGNRILKFTSQLILKSSPRWAEQ